MTSSPQRFLSNDRNLLRDATLVASSVLPVENAVLTLPTARKGTAQVTLTGTYGGAEEALYELEILDTDADNVRPSAPSACQGEGTGTLEIISVPGPVQTYTLECNVAGTPANTAELDVEGQKIKARTAGESGNSIFVTVDQSTLVFTLSTYSLLADLSAGAGGDSSPMIGPGFDWDTAAISNDGLVIPATAHRVAFGNDRSKVYLSFKKFVAGDWQYRLVPALARNVPRGTPIYFVTGGREVTISSDATSPATTEVYPDIETAYDLLNVLRTDSDLVVVEGVVANDRSPTGQASRELTIRTDAHAEVSTGTGSKYATGFVDVTVEPDAPTELVTAECFASSAIDHPLASLGRTRWQLTGSLSGNLGVIVEGVPFVGPNFSLTIPQKFPPGYGTEKGRFSVVSIDCMVRNPEEQPCPPICPVLAPLGPAAVDQTITLTYARRPSGTCNCDNMPTPFFNAFCLGIEGGDGDGTMTYSAENRVRLTNLYGWLADIVRANSTQGTGSASNDYDQAPLLANPIVRHATERGVDERLVQLDVEEHGALEHEGAVITSTQGTTAKGGVGYGWGIEESGLASSIFAHDFRAFSKVAYAPFEVESLKEMVRRFERALGVINDLEPSDESPNPKDTAEAAWDTAVAELEADVEAQLGAVTYSLFGTDIPDPEIGIDVEAAETVVAGDLVLVYREPGTDDHLLVRKWVPGIAGAKGFVLTGGGVSSPETMVRVYFAGVNDSATAEAAIVPGSNYGGSLAVAGQYVKDGTNRVGVGVSTTSISHDVTFAGLTAGGGASNRLTILADRYRTRLDWVLITGGISPLGKSDASSQLESGDGCWRDTGAQLWWEVVGSEAGGYAPLFTNTPYYSSRRAVQNGKFYSTHEFGLQVNVKCPERLKIGDRIVLQISDASWGSTYQRGDELLLPIVAGAPLFLSGGRDPDPVQTWNIRGSVDGPLPDYTFDPDSPAAYSNAGLSFLLHEGGVPFAKGDRFRWDAEGGHFRWRKNGGAWNEGSPDFSIPTSSIEIDSGLSANFYPGAASSFIAGDVYRFRALQPWAVSNMQSPKSVNRAWKWDAQDSPATAVLEADLGSVQQLDMIAMLLTLPDGATATLEGGISAANEWSESLTYRAGQIWKSIDREARYVKLTFVNSEGGSLRYAWLGVPLQTEMSADWNPRLTYVMGRSGSLPGGRFLGKSVSGEVVWPPEGSTSHGLTEVEAEAFAEMVDYIKEHDDEPIILIPQITRTTEPFVYGIVNADEVDFHDDRGYQPNVDASRRISATIPIAGVPQ